MIVAADQLSYADLYERWERGNWRATEIDFSTDPDDWHGALDDLQRRAALWNYALFLHGEDSVASNLSPYIDAAPLPEQKYFLATQQVDEARHAVFFDRFMREVVGIGGGSIADSLEATELELTWCFRKTFERLDKMADELRRDRSRPKLAAAVTLYHVIIEATLAQPGQHFIDSYLEERGWLPGFRSGMANVAHDENRHIGFGVKLLADLKREDPDVPHAVADLLREVIPVTTAVFVPPGWDRRYTESFGFSLEEIFAFGSRSLDQKLAAAGMPLESLPGPPPGPVHLDHEDRARRGIAMLQAGLIGEKLGPPRADREAMAMLFDNVEHSVMHENAPRQPTIIQWDFSDAEPWHLRIDNGSTSVEPGRVEDADLVLRSRFEDWVDVAVGREDARLAMAKRKLRPSGSLRVLMRMPKLFGR